MLVSGEAMRVVIILIWAIEPFVFIEGRQNPVVGKVRQLGRDLARRLRSNV